MTCSVKGVGATRIWYPRRIRGRRPMTCAFLPFDMAKDKGRPNSQRVPSIPAKGKERPPLVARDAGSLKWPIAHARP
jgi:hypothetical protein